MAVSDSPLAALAFVIAFPFITQRVLPILASPERLRAALAPSVSGRRSLRSSPAEALLLVLCLIVIFWNAFRCNPRNTAARAAKDVFRHARLDIAASTTRLRARLALLTPSQLGIDHIAFVDPAEASRAEAEGMDVIDRLLRRLGNMGGRQLYLLLGPRPFLECLYCKHESDLRLYALPHLLLEYSAHAVLFGILTMKGSSLNVLDGLLAPVWPWASYGTDRPSHPGNLGAIRPSSTVWRRPSYLFVVFAFFSEIAITLGWVTWPWSSDPRSLWNHPHHNLFLLRHAGLCVMTALIYLYPTRTVTSADRASAASEEMGRAVAQLGGLLSAAHDNINCATSNVSLIHKGRQAIWTDFGMREAVSKWYEEQQRPSSLEDPLLEHADDVLDTDWVLQEANKRGFLVPGATGKVKDQVAKQLRSVDSVHQRSRRRTGSKADSLHQSRKQSDEQAVESTEAVLVTAPTEGTAPTASTQNLTGEGLAKAAALSGGIGESEPPPLASPVESS
ncbi:unnamed protein product [Parajaminaea phylloscopi]